LRRLRDLGKSEARLLAGVRAHVMKSRVNGDWWRDTAHIHPSEMAKADWCPRETYFRMTNEAITDPVTNPSFQMESIFEEGHEIHRKWQTWFWEMGVLYGWWMCVACGHEWEACSPQICPRCFAIKDAVSYLEVPIEVPEYQILGHSDGAIHDAKGKVLIEVKSVGVGTLRFEAPDLHQKVVEGMDLKEVWKRIRRPFAAHLIQGQLYLWAMPEYDEIVFIYEFKPNQSVREFRVRRQPQIIADRLASCKDIVHGLRSGFPPYRPDWATSAEGPKCKSCVYRTTCWGLEQDNGDQEAIESRTVVRVRKSAGGIKGAKRRAGATAQAG